MSESGQQQHTYTHHLLCANLNNTIQGIHSMYFISTTMGSSTPRAFPIIWVAGIVLNNMLPLCSVQCVLLFYLHPFHISFTLVFPPGFVSFLCLFPGTGASNIILSTCPSSHFRLFSVMFFVTTSTNPCICSFLSVSYFVTARIHGLLL